MPKLIKFFRKRKARKMRKYAHYVEGEKPGTTSTHIMVDDIKDNPTKKYHVWPSIITDKKGYTKQSFQEAKERGEVFQFRSKKKADKFAKGSWKKRMSRGGLIQHD